MSEVGEIVMYGRVVLRKVKCWRCKFRGEYRWSTDKKMYCTKTKRWGSIERAYYCERFESNSSSYDDFSKIKEPNDITYAAMEKSEQNEDIYGPFKTVTDLMKKLDE